MLVLSRKATESIVIDGRIRITIMKTGGSSVRLGIDAPKDVTIHREEVQNRIQAEERATRILHQPYCGV